MSSSGWIYWMRTRTVCLLTLGLTIGTLLLHQSIWDMVMYSTEQSMGKIYQSILFCWNYVWIIIWYRPLWHMYLFYFHQGADIADICSKLTHVGAHFWEKNPMECYELISNRYYGYIYMIQSLLMWVFLTYLVYRLIQRWTTTPSLIVYCPQTPQFVGETFPERRKTFA